LYASLTSSSLRSAVLPDSQSVALEEECAATQQPPSLLIPPTRRQQTSYERLREMTAD
jgi:hypothetical protein